MKKTKTNSKIFLLQPHPRFCLSQWQCMIFSHTSNANFSSSIYRRLLQKILVLAATCNKNLNVLFFCTSEHKVWKKNVCGKFTCFFSSSHIKVLHLLSYAWLTKALSGNSTKCRIAYEQLYKKTKKLGDINCKFDKKFSYVYFIR